MLALIDCNACYASIQAIFRPDLRDKPIVVLSNQDGCIVTRNSYAKELDIPELAPYFKIKDILAKNNVHVFSSNYELIGDISRRIMDLISTFSDSIEIYSVDECFISINEKNNLIEFGQHIKNEVWRQQRMPVCVGIAETKTLAKLANHIAKKSKRLNGVCLIEDITKWDAVFKKLHVSKIWGVGSRITARLALMGVNTVYDLIRQPSKRIRKEFGVTLERTVNELNGEKCFDLETEPKPKKEIMTYKSFGTKTKDLNILKGYLACFVSTAVEKLNKQIGLTSCISVTIETSRFDVKSYKRGATIMLPYPTNDLRIITRYALFVCEKLFMSDYLYVRAGIGLYDLSNSEQTQYDLFEKGQTVKAYKLMEVMNTVNDRYGRNQIYLGAQGTKNKWSLVGAYKSPSYTTRFSDIPIIKI